MRIFFSIIFLLTINCINGQVGETYLQEKSSNAVLLEDHTEFTLWDQRRSQYLRHYRILIKNSFAKSHGNINIYYDQYREVTYGNIEVKDANGKVVEEYPLYAFDDQAASSGGVASDGRLKTKNISYDHYPFEIEVRYTVKNTGSLHFPKWDPLSQKMRLLQSDLKVIDAKGDNFRFAEYNVPAAKITSEEESKIYQWELENIAPFTYEDFNYVKEDYAPIVITAPANFEMDGKKGNMNSWSSFGTWIGELNSDRNDIKNISLPDLDALVAAAVSKEEKTAIVYNYLQRNTRYVSIQLGLGGWQPFPASMVQDKKYGDCKALSFYTKSLLEKYNIDSHYTLIKAGNYATAIDANFPNAHFNHAILTVPMEADTIFLECTSQTSPFGYMGKFTGNRSALLITEEGGQLINTKKYTPQENLQTSTTEIIFNAEGAATINMRRMYQGLEVENFGLLRLYEADSKDRQEWLLENYRWNNTKQSSFKLTELIEGVIPQGGFKAELSCNKGATKMGKRWFIPVGKYVDSHLGKLTAKERKAPIRIRYGYQQKDTLNYTLPENFNVEKMPKSISISNAFGEYTRTITRAGTQLTILRTFTLNDGKFPPSTYPEFQTFVKNVLKYDGEKLVLLAQG